MPVDLSTLVDHDVVRAVTKFPVVAALNSMSKSPARLYLVQIPGQVDVTAPDAWAAVVLVGNPAGGIAPVLMVAEVITRIVSFTPQRGMMLLDTGATLEVTPSRGCGGCGNVLKSYNTWPGATVRYVPTPSPTVWS